MNDESNSDSSFIILTSAFKQEPGVHRRRVVR
jgi:hypothetical protein